ncbi:glycerol-3-phosphate ABC transporter permease [Brachybacterium endophyticum]|uniref:Glycerol-3-phosphate ABC transporter permease n=1 Tax=Brachybacterium endophyticum TaxID=2182385 RepID=A0A2U2RLQ9_9MICO|nr:carbohydrate ABC transporter permease [Brachybacterium endophyticum]PWH06771.1 glycerol-3-phosphate ABC transporter permease [Brachybacterium endophyticum]
MSSAVPTAPSAPTPSDTSLPTSGPTPTGADPSRRPLWLRIVLTVLVIACGLVFLVPIYWLFSGAVKSNDDIYSWPLKWIPTALHFENFREAWETVPFGRFALNSLITTSIGTALEMINAILCAYAFAFVPFRYKNAMFLFMIGSMMLPGHVTLIVNYITVGNLGLLNTYPGLILPGIGSAFAMFLLYQQMRTVDPEILQAAEVDGAGHWRRMVTIVVPMSAPMILTATLIVMIGKWNEYVWPLISTNTANMRTLPIGLLYLRSQEGYTNWGALLAGTLMAALPMLILFFLAQRRIIGGMAAGAIK